LPIGHSSSIRSFHLYPDGKKVVTASFDHFAKIWDAQTGMLLMDLKGHTDWVNTVNISPDGKKILTASSDHTAKIWDAESGILLIDLKGHSKGVQSASFSPDGKRIITVSDDQTVKVWNTATGICLKSIEGDWEFIKSAYFTKDGNRIMTDFLNGDSKVWDAYTYALLKDIKFQTNGGIISALSFDGGKAVWILPDSPAKIWDTRKEKVLVTLKGDSDLSFFRFSPDGKKVLGGSWNSMAKIWDVETGNLLAELKGPSQKIRLTDFYTDGKKVVTGHGDSTLKLWNVQTGKLMADLKTGNDLINTVSFSNDGKKIIAVADDNSLKIWDSQNGLLLNIIKGNLTNANNYSAFSPDAKTVALSTDNYIIRNWDIYAVDLRSCMTGHEKWIHSVSFSGDGTKIVTSSEDRTAKVWEAESGKLLYNLTGHNIEVMTASFSGDGKKIITASNDNTAKCWDAQTGSLLFTIGYGLGINLVKASFSHDGEKIVASPGDNTAKILDAQNGVLLQEFKEEEGIAIFSAAFSPDDKKIVTRASDGVTRIWDLKTGANLVKLEGSIQWTVDEMPYFLPDGDRVIACCSDSTIRAWDVQTGQIVLQLKNYYGLNFEAKLFPFSKKIIARGSDDIARVWDLKTGASFCELRGHTSKLISMSISPDEKIIVTTSEDKTLKVWNTASCELVYTLIYIDNNSFLVQLPSGYYQTTPAAVKLLHYVTKDLKVISFEQLDIKYNRPDKVLEAIGNTDTALMKSYRKAWEKRIKKLGIDTTAFRDGYSVPEADFVNRDSIDYEQKTGTLRLHIKGVDSTYQLDRFNVWVNESPLFGQRGIRIRKKNSNTLDTTISIVLSQGENRIECSITNVNGTESYRMPLYVKYTPVVKQKEMTRFIGIGIDQFKESNYNLQYSSKDIRDLAVKLKEKYKDNITIDTLFNENVTTEKVKVLKEKLKQTTVNDKVIISYSGHGLLSKEYDYYLSTYAVNFSKPEENGLPYDELESLLDSIPARKKLLLIDACHSGEVDKEEGIAMQKMADSLGLSKGIDLGNTAATTQHVGLKNSFELMQSLFVNVGKSTGATIISAAAGNQFALERGDLKNGVFTYSLLEAMNNNPTIKISELKKIVGERVEQLTNGLQKPTSRNENIAVDWSL